MAINRLLTSRAIIGSIYNRLTLGDQSWIDRYTMKMGSNQAIENYAWLGMVPQMREWIGGRQPKTVRENVFSVANKPYESTLEIMTSDLRRDQSGQIMVRIGELARRVLSFPASLLSTLMIAGESTVCYDGQFFFDTDHAEGSSGSQNNDLSHAAATGTSPTVPEMRDAIMEAVAAILGFKDDQGEPMNEGARAFEVMVPTLFFPVAAAAITLPVIDSGVSNIIPALPDFSIKPVVNSRLSAWTDKMMVYRTDAETKPFILQEEVPLFVDAVAEGSELEFTDKKHWYGVQWEGAVAYGFWQHACLMTFT